MTPDAIRQAMARSAQAIVESAALNAAVLSVAAHRIAWRIHRGGTIWLIGNGGSAATASHIAGEFVGRFKSERDSIRAFALMVDPATTTAIANDYGYEYVFCRQMEMVRDGDVLLAYSTSGKSKNVVLAVTRVIRRDVTIAAFVGAHGEGVGQTLEIREDGADAYLFRVPSADTPHIQEAHDAMAHCLVEAVDDELAILQAEARMLRNEVNA